MTESVLTANLLIEGSVVYLTPSGDWSGSLPDAAIARDEREKTALQARADEAVAARRVVDPYFFAVSVLDGTTLPLGTREIIRASGGPTVTPPGAAQGVESPPAPAATRRIVES